MKMKKLCSIIAVGCLAVMSSVFASQKSCHDLNGTWQGIGEFQPVPLVEMITVNITGGSNKMVKISDHCADPSFDDRYMEGRAKCVRDKNGQEKLRLITNKGWAEIELKDKADPFFNKSAKMHLHFDSDDIGLGGTDQVLDLQDL